jgi:hypothetical protein
MSGSGGMGISGVVSAVDGDGLVMSSAERERNGDEGEV